jgi:hypothetical protein
VVPGIVAWTLNTPIGNVVMGQNVYKGGDVFEKMKAKTNEKHNRENDIFKIRTTLTKPSIILRTLRYKNGLIYAKVFNDTETGGKGRQVFSVIVVEGDVISSYNEDHARIRDFVDSNITSPEHLIWPQKMAATLSSNQTQ